MSKIISFIDKKEPMRYTTFIPDPESTKRKGICITCYSCAPVPHGKTIQTKFPRYKNSKSSSSAKIGNRLYTIEEEVDVLQSHPGQDAGVLDDTRYTQKKMQNGLMAID